MDDGLLLGMSGISNPASRSGVGPSGTHPSVETRQLEEAAHTFEAYFLSLMLKEMRKTVPENSFSGAGPGQGIYQSLFDEALGQALAQHGGIGLSQVLVQQQLKNEQKTPQDFGGIDRYLKYRGLPTGR